MTISRSLFTLVLLLGVIAALRLIYVTRDYSAAIETLRGLNISVVAAEPSAHDQLQLNIEVRNDASRAVVVEYLHLNLLSERGRLGGTFERIPVFDVEAGSARTITAVIDLLPGRTLEEPLPASLSLRGEWRMRVATSNRSFQQPVRVTWEQEP